MDTLMRLKNVSLFASLTPANLARVAEITTRRSYAKGSFLCRRGELGNAFYVICSGEAVQHQTGLLAAEGAVTYIREGEAIGEDALLLGDVYSFSLQAATDVEALSIHKQDLDRLLRQYPQISHQLKPSRLVLERLHAPTFPWQDEDETTLLLRKRHWFAFVRNLLMPLLALLGLTIVAWLLGQVNILTSTPLTLLFIGTVPAAMALWFFLDWQNDFYLVTTKRILHEERVILIYQTWEEVLLDKVQDTTITRGFLGNMLGFGTLRIQTASLRGAMVLDCLPDPDDVQEVIYKQTSQFGSSALRDEEIRQKLLKQIGGSETEEEPLVPPPPPQEQPQTKTGPLARFLPSRVLRLRSKEGPQITWRKHWIFLIRRVYLPLPAVLITSALIVLSLLDLSARYRFSLLLISFILWIVSLVWLWWQVEDWGNDLYIVTDRLIIDVEKKPLFFSEQRRQATLDMIQNVSLQKQGLLPAVLNYGDVVIQTAGATGEFTFAGVSNPMQVQREIFRRVDKYNADKQQRESERERAEMSKWFRVYHEMNQSSEASDS